MLVYSSSIVINIFDCLHLVEVTSYSKTFYYDNAGRLLTESINETAYGVGNTSRAINFIYDESSMIGFEYSNGTDESVYYYQRNLLGDVIAIYDTTGTKVVEYAYDAWGNCTITSSTTNYNLAHANPIRYRGYYYDEDTKLYYLNARYYSPEFRRFISPDDTNYLDPESVNGLNLYCYCNNDPVNYYDPSGHAFLLILGISGIVAGLAYGVYKDYKDDDSINGSIGWQGYLEYGIKGGLIGLGVGLGIQYLGAAVSYIGGALSSFGAPSALAVAGGGTVAVANAGILEAMLAAEILIMFAKGDGPRMGHNQYEKQQIDSLSSKYKLTKRERRRLHDYISGERLTYHEIEEIIKMLFGK